MKRFLKIPYKCWCTTLTILIVLFSTSAFAGGNFKGKTVLEGTEFEVGEQFLVQYKLLASGSYSLRNPRFGISNADFGDLEIIRKGQDGNMSFGFGDNAVFNYKYFLKAKKPGTYTIPALTIVMDGKSYNTQKKKVTIIPQTKDSNVAGDLMLQLKPNKTSVYVGEPIRYDLHWYSAFQTRGFQMKELPKFDGFVVKTIPSKTQNKIRTINGKRYLTNKEYSFILTPIKPGKIKLPEVKGDMYLTSGRGFLSSTETRPISSGRISLNVKPLPKAPSSVQGKVIVGNFKSKTSLDKKSLTVNDAVTIKLTVSGSGNLNTLNDLNIEFPSAFEALPPTVKNNVLTDGNGIHGSKTFEFVAIPRQPGEFSISSLTFWAFNPKTAKYYSISSSPLTIQVTGDGSTDANPYISGNNGKEVELQGSDIRYLNEIDELFDGPKSNFTNSFAQYILLLLSSVAFIIGAFAFKRKKANNSEIKTHKKAKANKIAQKYLKNAQKELNGDKNLFYELVDEAINNYLLGKLMIDQTQLNSTNITQELINLGVNQATIDETLKISKDCKMARFSPISLPPLEMFGKAENVINELENQIK